MTAIALRALGVALVVWFIWWISRNDSNKDVAMLVLATVLGGLCIVIAGCAVGYFIIWGWP